MAIRNIIQIDEDKCNGCGLCVPNCAEGALKIIDGKAKVVKDSYCDGLGACLGHCPQDALKIIQREADDFDEEEAMKFVKSQKKANEAHKEAPHGHAHGGCPGTRMRALAQDTAASSAAVNTNDVEIKIKSQLRQWPVQLKLVPVTAPWFDNADVLVTADCVPFAHPNYHLELLKGKVVLVGCPKLDDVEYYLEKLQEIFENNSIKSVTVAHMEVPCCSGIVRAVELALQRSGKNIPLKKVRVGIEGSSTNW